MEIIIERLIQCRKNLGISKQEASRRIGISQPAYLRYESGDRTPSPHVIKQIANAFHTSVDYLTGNSSDPSSDFFEIKKDDNKDLYLIVEQLLNMNSSQQKRILNYVENLSKEER